MCDLGLAGGEELVHVPAAALAPRPRQHRPERVHLREPVPVLLVAVEIRRGISVPAPDDLGVGLQLVPVGAHPGLEVGGKVRLLDREREQVRLAREHARDAGHDRPREPQDARAGAAVDLDERLGQLELAEEADPVAGVRRERRDRLLDLALRPAVDVVRRARVRDAARAEAVSGDRGELVLVDGAELDGDAHQRAVTALERERGDTGDPVELEQRAVRRAAVVEPGRDDGQVEAAVRVVERLGVLEAPLVGRELLDGDLLVHVRDRHVLETELVESVTVGRAAGDDEHAHLAAEDALVEQLLEDAAVEAAALVRHRAEASPDAPSARGGSRASRAAPPRPRPAGAPRAGRAA